LRGSDLQGSSTALNAECPMKSIRYALIAMAAALQFGCNDSEGNRKDKAMSDAGRTQKKEDLKKSNTPHGTEIATLGGGCFWCLEAVFERLEGVEKVESGYSGGAVPNPTYEQVCRKDTGHAEVVQVTFDPAVLSFRDLLDVFFAMHDPTTPN